MYIDAEKNHQRKERIRTLPLSGLNVVEQLTKLRIELGFTQADVAHKMKTSSSSVARLESGAGEKHDPKLGTLKKYAKAIGVKLVIRAERKVADVPFPW